MNVKGFFVTALSQALDLSIASPDDVLRHVTPELLANYLPRPLWARLLTACMGASKVDAQLVVETIGVPNLCEHIPSQVIWACLKEIAQRTLGREVTHEPLVALPPPLVSRPTAAIPLSMTPPPAERAKTPAPGVPVAVGPSIPPPGSAQGLADVVAALESDERPSASGRSRSPTQQRFRQSNTGIGRLAATNTRRPQATATPTVSEPPPPPAARQVRRGSTEADAYDIETEVGKDDWKNALAVEDEQLVDWSGTDETVTSSETHDGYGRKR